MNNNTPARNKEISAEILRQLGGPRIAIMLGTTGFLAIENGLQFDFKGNRKINKCLIKLDAWDTYTVEFWNIRRVKWELACDLIHSFERVYNDGLVRVFQDTTGLNLTL